MNVAKEALQRYLLAALQREGLLTHAAFIGGTALRLLHELPRYSEDLDFIWTNKNAESQLAEWTKYLPKAIRALGALPEIDAKNKSKDDAKVQKRGHSIVISATAPAFTAFAPHGIQIRFDIDLDPPAQTQPESKTMRLQGGQIEIPSLTLPSLMAGKLHILLTRPDREKGRDWFDYTWYRQKKILPNIPMLESAIQQTANGPDARYWTSYLRQRAKTVQWINVRSDVKPFLEDPADSDSLNEVKIDHATPYPDFAEIEAEFFKQKDQHPLFLTKNPVMLDIHQAALEGDVAAIDLERAIVALRPQMPPPPPKAQGPSMDDF